MDGNAVALRPLVPGDAEIMAAWADDPSFCLEADWTAGLPLAEHRRFHLGLIVSPPVDLLRLGAISGDVLVGYVDLHGDEPGRRELGFVIGGRERWGRGLGRLAAAGGLDHGFEYIGLDEIWAEALDANERSTRLLRSLGMTETGRGGSEDFAGRPSFYRQFAMSREQWTRVRETWSAGPSDT